LDIIKCTVVIRPQRGILCMTCEREGTRGHALIGTKVGRLTQIRDQKEGGSQSKRKQPRKEQKKKKEERDLGEKEEFFLRNKVSRKGWGSKKEGKGSSRMV